MEEEKKKLLEAGDEDAAKALEEAAKEKAAPMEIDFEDLDVMGVQDRGPCPFERALKGDRGKKGNTERREHGMKLYETDVFQPFFWLLVDVFSSVCCFVNPSN